MLQRTREKDLLVGMLAMESTSMINWLGTIGTFVTLLTCEIGKVAYTKPAASKEGKRARNAEGFMVEE